MDELVNVYGIFTERFDVGIVILNSRRATGGVDRALETDRR